MLRSCCGRGVLCSAVLCCAVAPPQGCAEVMLCCAVLCCAVLCCAVLLVPYFEAEGFACNCLNKASCCPSLPMTCAQDRVRSIFEAEGFDCEYVGAANKLMENRKKGEQLDRRFVQVRVQCGGQPVD